MKQAKAPHVYDWDQEPVSERPSEFSSTQGHSVLSGYHPMNDPMRRQSPRRGVGLKAVIVFWAVLLALGGFALARFAGHLRG